MSTFGGLPETPRQRRGHGARGYAEESLRCVRSIVNIGHARQGLFFDSAAFYAPLGSNTRLPIAARRGCYVARSFAPRKVICMLRRFVCSALVSTLFFSSGCVKKTDYDALRVKSA